MARLESGIRPEDAGQFWLKGHEMGLGQAQQQREEQQRRTEEQHRYMLEIQHAALEQKKEEARSQAILNERAQMGDAQSLQQLAMNIHAGQHPDAAILKDAMGTMQRITDPKARAIAMQSFHSAMGDLQKQRQRGIADQAVQRAGENGLVDPEQYKQRLDAGESPQAIVQELHKSEQDRNIKDLATQHSVEALTQAQGLMQTIKDPRTKLIANAVFTHFKNSPFDQADPKGAAKFMEEFQKAIIPSQKAMDAQAQQHKEHLQEMLGPNAQAPGMGGMTMGDMKGQLEKQPHGPVGFGLFGDSFGSGGPNIPTNTELPGTHATLRGKKGGMKAGTAKPTDIAQVFGAAKSADEFHAALQRMGVDPNSDEGAKLIIQALGGGDGQSDN